MEISLNDPISYMPPSPQTVAFIKHRREPIHVLPAPAPPTTATPPTFTCRVEGCNKFGKDFGTEFSLYQHNQARHPALCPPPPAPPAPKTFTCKQCPATFEKVWQVAQHVRITHPKANARPAQPREPQAKGFSCPNCDFASPRRNGLARHILNKHPDKPYQLASDEWICNLCDWTITAANLGNHFHRAHKPTGAKGNYRPNPMKTNAETNASPKAETAAPQTAAPVPVKSGAAVITVAKPAARETFAQLLAMGFTKIELTIA